MNLDWNVVAVNLNGCVETVTPAIYQHSHGIILNITDEDLPDYYRVEFANSVTGQSTGWIVMVTEQSGE